MTWPSPGVSSRSPDFSSAASAHAWVVAFADAVLRLLHPAPALRPTMDAAAALLESVLPRRPVPRPGDHRCV
ncbi:hypothetical protein [Amycolatopsis australiensis]|uniref:hypothetical protein n=1 Tax=Amycolatopsis australiensis TaxID=546364 RepID=UPI0015A6CA5F|nr:hypothetical protein [Amycolatopsis australiensis]